MASTTHIASQTLSIGDMTSAATITLSGERLALNIVAAQVGSEESLVCLIVRDANNVNLKTVKVIGSDTQRLVMDSGDLLGNTTLSVWIECLAGSATVQLVELTGSEGVLPGSGSTIELDDLAADFFAASAAGRGKFATDLFDDATLDDVVEDDAFTAAVVTAKFDDDSLTAANMADIIADDGFTAAVVTAKFADDSLTATNLADILEDDAITAAVASAKIDAAAITEDLRDGEPIVLADPGDGNTITPATSGTEICTIDVGTAAETRVMGTPDHVGQRLVLVGGTFGGGSLTITMAAGWKDGGAADDVATITAGDVMIAEACGAADTDWRCAVSNGVAFA